jgi:hypothetical protein
MHVEVLWDLIYIGHAYDMYLQVLWGMALKLPEFKELREYQRVNHFPGTYLLGRKDNMARVCNKFRRTFGTENFEYFPKTFICPGDRAELLADEDECKVEFLTNDP